MPEEMKKAHYGARRFGVVAVQEGFIRQEQLLKALSTQVLDNLEGRPHRLVGEILYDQGAMTMEQVHAVIKKIE